MRTLTTILVTASLAACATASASYEQAYQQCLRRPNYEPETATACTIVIDAPRTSAEDRAMAHNNRAQTRDPAEAMADLDAAIRIAPGIAALHRNRAGRHKDTRRTIADLDEAIRLDPNYSVAWSERAEAYARLKRYDLAIRDFNEAIRLAPGFVHPMYNPYQARAQAKEARGDRRGAAEDKTLSNYFFARASTLDGEVAGPNASGMRTWDSLIAK
jgi:tetratricopeptide (TPR) repeat protein